MGFNRFSCTKNEDNWRQSLLDMSVSFRPFWLVCLKRYCFHAFEFVMQFEDAAFFMQEMRLSKPAMPCSHAIFTQCSCRAFCSCKDIKTAGQEYFFVSVSYRSHSRVSHWVSTSVCLASGLSTVPWWKIDSWCYLSSSGTFLNWSNSILNGFLEGWSHIDAGNRTSILTGTDWCGWTWLWRFQSLHRSRLLDSFSSHNRALWRTGRWDLVIRTWEPSNQVFDAASSLHWIASQAYWSLITGSLGLLWLFFGGSLLRTKWWLYGRRLGCVLKEVNTITDP